MPQRLMPEMNEGVMDLVVIYRPEQRPGMVVEELMEDRLILVTARPDTPLKDNYLFIDWGEEFRVAHAAAFPELRNPGLTLDLGALGINLLVNAGGAGYRPERVVQSHVEGGLLTPVRDTMQFPYPAYIVYQEEFSTPTIIERALGTLRSVASEAIKGDPQPPFWA